MIDATATKTTAEINDIRAFGLNTDWKKGDTRFVDECSHKCRHLAKQNELNYNGVIYPRLFAECKLFDKSLIVEEMTGGDKYERCKECLECTGVGTDNHYPMSLDRYIARMELPRATQGRKMLDDRTFYAAPVKAPFDGETYFYDADDEPLEPKAWITRINGQWVAQLNNFTWAEFCENYLKETQPETEQIVSDSLEAVLESLERLMFARKLASGTQTVWIDPEFDEDNDTVSQENNQEINDRMALTA